MEGASDYSREAIILNISVKAEGGDAINPAAGGYYSRKYGGHCNEN